MAIPTRTAIPGTYFVTAATHQRRRLFQVTANAELFIATLHHYREHFTLHAYVLMPDHIHLLITPQGITLERAMQFIGFHQGRLLSPPRLEVSRLAARLHRPLHPR